MEDKKYSFRNVSLPAVWLFLNTLVFNFWVTGERNWFVLDDMAWLARIKFQSIREIISFWPVQAYNDRPVGALYYKLLYEIFGMNATIFHIAGLGIHLINTFLVLALLQKVNQCIDLKFKPATPYFAAAIFGAWPKSLMAVQWSAAIFDLLGCTFLLLTLLLSFRFIFARSTRESISSLLFSLVAFYLGLRTKEMTVTAPALILGVSLVGQMPWIDFKKRLVVLTSSLGSVAAAFVLTILYYIKKGEAGVNVSDSPYKVTASLGIIIRNIYRYLYLYCDLPSSAQMFQKPTLMMSNLYIAIFIFTASYAAIKLNKKLLGFFVIFAISMSPVLIMANMQHILYLYIPSIFLAVLAGNAIALVKIEKLYYRPIVWNFLAATLLILAGQKSFGPREAKYWWRHIASKDHSSFEDLKKIQLSLKTSPAHVYVERGDVGYTIFNPYGPGDINRIIFNNKNIDTVFVEKDDPSSNTLALVYNPDTGSIVEKK